MPMKLLTASSKDLANWPKADLPFSAWLHFEREWTSRDEISVSRIIESGCRLLMITGEYSDAANDQIDWLIPDITKNTVLTIEAKEINKQTAFDFLSTRCPGGKTAYGVIAVFANDLPTEMHVMVKIKRTIELCEASR